MAGEQFVWRVAKRGSTKTGRRTVGDAGPPAASDAPSSQSDDKFQFQLVSIDSGYVVGSATARKEARAYVAKATHARQRRERMLQYQETRRREYEQDATLTTPIDPQARRGPVAPTHQRSHSAGLLPVGPMMLLSASHIDPFDSAARPMSMFDHYLLAHYKEVVVPLGQSSAFSFLDGITYMQVVSNDWIPFVLTDPGLLDGVLISACRSLHVLCGGRGSYLAAALGYKARCIESLQQDLSDESVAPRGTTIAKAITLAGEEVAMGNLPTAKQHIDAALQMVARCGDLSGLGTCKYLLGLLNQFSSEKLARIEAAVIFTKYSYLRDSDGTVD